MLKSSEEMHETNQQLSSLFKETFRNVILASKFLKCF